MYALRDVLVALVGGVLLGMLLMLRRNGRSAKDRPLARLLGLMLEPLYWWLDLWSPGREGDKVPSHRKVLYTITMVAMLAITAATAATDVAADGSLSLNSWLLSATVMLFALGPHAYNAALTKIVGATNLADHLAARATPAAGQPRPSAPGMEAVKL